MSKKYALFIAALIVYCVFSALIAGEAVRIFQSIGRWGVPVGWTATQHNAMHESHAALLLFSAVMFLLPAVQTMRSKISDIYYLLLLFLVPWLTLVGPLLASIGVEYLFGPEIYWTMSLFTRVGVGFFFLFAAIYLGGEAKTWLEERFYERREVSEKRKREEDQERGSRLALNTEDAEFIVLDEEMIAVLRERNLLK